MPIPGLVRFRPSGFSGFDPITFTSSGTFEIPNGIEQIRIVSKARDANGTWMSWSQIILRMTRNISSLAPNDPPDAWAEFIGLGGSEIQKFQPDFGFWGEAVNYYYLSGTRQIRYLDSTPNGLPRSINNTPSPINRHERFRNTSVSFPNFT